MSDRNRLTVELPDKLMEAVDAAVEDGYYVNRSAAVRDAIRLLLAGYLDPEDAIELRRGHPPKYDVDPRGECDA